MADTASQRHSRLSEPHPRCPSLKTSAEPEAHEARGSGAVLRKHSSMQARHPQPLHEAMHDLSVQRSGDSSEELASHPRPATPGSPISVGLQRHRMFEPSNSARISLNAHVHEEIHRKRVFNLSDKHTLVGHAEEVSALCFSPDSLMLASGSEDRTVRLWDPASGHLRNIFTGHKGKVHALSFIGSGTILFSASKDKTIIEWDMLRNLQRKTIAGHSNVVWDVQMSADGTRAVSVSHDETIRWWNTMTGEETQCVRNAHNSTIYTAGVSCDGEYLATGSADKTIRIWDMQSGECVRMLHGHTGHVTSLAWHPDNPDMLVSGSWDETVNIWNWTEDDMPLHTLVGHHAKVNSVCLSPDGDCIVSGGEDRMVRLWRISTHECFLTRPGHKDDITCVAISPDGTTLASASKDKTIRTYKVLSM